MIRISGLLRTSYCLLLVFFVLANQAVAVPTVIKLSQQERDWLNQHPVIRVAPDPYFAPIEWFNHVGNYQGMTSDYIHLLEQKLPIQIKIVRAQTWKAAMNMARNRQVDVLTAVSRTPQRESYLLFSQPYITMKGAIISNQDLPGLHVLSDLKGYKVAVVKGYRWDEELTAKSDKIIITQFHDLQTALTSTMLGLTDVTVSGVESARHVQRMEGLVDLNIVATLPQEIKLNFGIRKDWPQLVSILNKGLASISRAEKVAIRKVWLEVNVPVSPINPLYKYIALAIVAMLLLTVSVVIIWNRMLKIQVRRRSRELKDAQILLIHAEKMESIGRLAAGVAHEVKNPLAIIQMGTDYLSQELAANETTAAVITDIDDAVQRADTVIKALLDFSRDQQLELKPGNLIDIIQHSLHLVSHEMRQRNIEVKSDLAEDIPQIDLDANKLQQVLINLFMNAVHAMQHNGELLVSCYIKTLTRKVELDYDHSKRFKLGESVVWVQVMDSGPGIREQDRNRIFDPFYTTKPVGEGTGLGLSVSRTIINLHHASIDIRNRAEGGVVVALMFKLKAGDK